MENSQGQDSALSNTTIGPGSFAAPAPVAQTAPTVVKTAPIAAPAPVDNPGIVSSTAAKTSLATDGNNLDKMTNAVVPYEEYLQKQAAALQNGTDTTNAGSEKNAIATASATSKSAQDKVQGDYARYQAGLQTLGIQSGLAQMAPELQGGRMLQAANDESSKLQQIQQKQDFAIARAKDARSKNDAVALKSTMAELGSLQKEKAATINAQLTKQTHDVAIAKSSAAALSAQLKNTPHDQKETLINQYASDRGISPLALHDALITEQNTERHTNLTESLQEKALNKSSSSSPSAKILSTASLNYLKKNNPAVDIGFGDTQEDADRAIASAKQGLSLVKKDFTDPTHIGPQGYLTYAYGKNLFNNLPPGINKVGFISSIKDMLTPDLNKNGSSYGLSPSEIAQINALP
jgi:hypothetical protein